MGEIRHFAIQRSDGLWYAGRQNDGSESWTGEPGEATHFNRYADAVEALNRLRRQGHDVQLFGKE